MFAVDASTSDAVAAVPMVTLPSGKRQCPSGYTQRPRGSGRCLPSKPRSQRRHHHKRSRASPESSPSNDGDDAPPSKRPPLATTPKTNSLTPFQSPAPLPPIPTPFITPTPLSSIPTPFVTPAPLPPIPAPFMTPTPVAAAAPVPIILPNGKKRCPPGHVQRPSGSGKCVPAPTRRRPPHHHHRPTTPVMAAASTNSALSFSSSSSSSSNNTSSTPSSFTGDVGSSSIGKNGNNSSSSSDGSSPSSSDGSSSSSSNGSSSSSSNGSSSSSSNGSSSSSSNGSSSSSSGDGSSNSSSASLAAAAVVLPPPLPRPQKRSIAQAMGAAAADDDGVAERVAKDDQKAERDVYDAHVARYQATLERHPTNPFAPPEGTPADAALDDDLFPEHDDPLFALQLARRAEFADATYDGTIAPVAQRAEEVCAAPFEILPNQRFAQSLISPDSPLNAALLYHELGTGKTFTCQTITEQFRLTNKAAGVPRPVFVIAAPNVLNNFRAQMFAPDELKPNPHTGVLEMPPGTIGAQLLHEINPTPHLGQLAREELLEGVKHVIDGAYTFIGYTAFANLVYDLAVYDRKQKNYVVDADGEKQYASRDLGELKRLLSGERTSDLHGILQNKRMIRDAKQRLQAKFDNCFLAVDEAHNINERDSGGNNVAAIELVARYCNIKLLLMSATPMFNSHRELVPLVNLLNAVDRRAPIHDSQVFDAQGAFVEADPADPTSESGRDLLARKLTGYVSFVRGETPYAFPFRLLPDTFLDMTVPEDARHRLLPEHYPRRKLNGRPLTNPPKFLQLFASTLPVYQRRAYLAKIAQMAKNATGSSSTSSTSSTSSSSSATTSHSSNTSDDEEKKEEEGGDEEEGGYGGGDLDSIPDSVLELPDDKQEGINYTKLSPLMNLCNIVYPLAAWDKHLAEQRPADEFDPALLKSMTGKDGLKRYLTWVGGETNKTKENVPMHHFRYRVDDPNNHIRMFSPKTLDLYSAKIAAVVDRVRRSTGLVLIYSNFIEGCLLPIALALEQAGLVGVEGVGDPRNPTKSQRMLWHPDELKHVPPLIVPPAPGAAAGTAGTRACYTMLTGRSALSPNNRLNVQLAVAENNKYGQQIKVVLYTTAGSESVNYKNVRQVHVMEPWYNLNRLEQVVGRGVRNRSHCGLPFALRNTEVYYHAAVLPSARGAAPTDDAAHGESAADDADALSVAAQSDVETADLYLYRYSEDKERLMAPARRLLKEASVDCLTNRGQQNFTLEQMDQEVVLELATGKRSITFAVGDRPFTNMCDYLGDCQYQCHAPSAPLRAVVNSAAAAADGAQTSLTYGPRALRKDEARLVRRIQDLYRERPFYSFAELRALLTVQQRIPEVQIYAAVQALLRDPSLLLVNGAGQRGRLIAIARYNTANNAANKRRRLNAAADSSSGSSSTAQDDDDDVDEVWYLFQPVHITDRNASVFERGTRAVDKPRVVQFTRPETIDVAVAAPVDPAAATEPAAPPATAAYDPAEPDEGNTEQAVAFRASLCPHLLTYLLAVTVFGQNVAQSQIPRDRVKAVAAAAKGLVQANSWYKAMAGIAQAVADDKPAGVVQDLPFEFLVWTVAQHFLDSRPVLERAQMLRALLAEDGAYLSSAQDVEFLRTQALPTNWRGSVGWPERVRFCLRRYFAQRVYFEPAGGTDHRVAVMADMTGKGPPKLWAAILSDPKVKLYTLEGAGEWVRAAALQRNKEPGDLAQRVEQEKEHTERTWPVLIPSLNGKLFQPGGWNAAMELRVKTLTNKVPNYTGGKLLAHVTAADAKQHWLDLQNIYGNPGPASGAPFLENMTGREASARYALLLLAAAHYRQCYSAITGEEYAFSSHAAPPAKGKAARRAAR